MSTDDKCAYKCLICEKPLLNIQKYESHAFRGSKPSSSFKPCKPNNPNLMDSMVKDLREI